MLPRYHRYVLGDLLRMFAIAGLILTGLAFLAGIAIYAIAGIQSVRLLKLIPIIIPDRLVFTLPLALLAACTLVYSRLSADNEILALKASGIPASTLLIPAYVLAIPLAIFSIALQGWICPEAEFQKRNIKKAVLDTLEEYLLSGQRSLSLGDVRLHWEDFRIVEDKPLSGPPRPRWLLDRVEFEDRRKGILRRIKAAQAEIYRTSAIDEEGDAVTSLVFDLTNVEFLTFDSPGNPQGSHAAFFRDTFLLTSSQVRRPGEMDTPTLRAYLDSQRNDVLAEAVAALRRRLAGLGTKLTSAAARDPESEAREILQAAERFQRRMPRPPAAILQELSSRTRTVGNELKDIRKASLDLYQRDVLSFGFLLIPPVCLTLCISAGRRQPAALGLTLAVFLGLFLIPTLGIRSLAVQTTFPLGPGFAIWLPTLATAAVAAWLFRRHVWK